MEAFQHIIIIALAQGWILAFFLLASKYYRSTPNKWLSATLILLTTISILDILGSLYTPSSRILEFIFFDLELGFLGYVPLYYFFKLSTSTSKKSSSFNYLLLLPFVVDTSINLYIFSNIPNESIGENLEVQLFYQVETFASILFNSILCYQSYIALKGYQNQPNKKKWIHRIWQSSVLIISAWLALSLSEYLLDDSWSIVIAGFHILVSMWMLWITYNGVVNLKLIDDRSDIDLRLRRKEIPRESKESIQLVDTVVGISSKDTSVKHNPALFKKHFATIKEIMLSESLYRNEDLGIEDIAHRVKMSSGYVSKIIKEVERKSFTYWVNELRVEKVKSMFEDRDFHHYSTLSIGLEAGFKSKSAFYSSFKKMTGETPAQFRKKVLISAQS